MHQKIRNFRYPIGGQQGKVVPMVLIFVTLLVAGAGAVMLLKTRNTVIVINEAATAPQERVVTESPQPQAEAPEPVPQVRISQTSVGYLNVRKSGSAQAEKIGEVKPGEVYEFTEVVNNWYHIVHPTLGEAAWVSGQYVTEVEAEAGNSNIFSPPSEI
ncbi:MAG TPA: SH3 domain-containing protein [Candidatus Paceibacterota bacterium]|nr:SH3 domain-containing protein [Candidatus Paceibacterota bacterium]